MAIVARYRGKCCNCKGGFSPGDKIVPQRPQQYAHEGCYIPRKRKSAQLLLPGMAVLSAIKAGQPK